MIDHLLTNKIFISCLQYLSVPDQCVVECCVVFTFYIEKNICFTPITYDKIDDTLLIFSQTLQCLPMMQEELHKMRLTTI